MNKSYPSWFAETKGNNTMMKRPTHRLNYPTPSVKRWDALSKERQQREFEKLPSPKTRRWVMRRKAQVVSAVRNGVITMADACATYRLSEEEFRNWEMLLDSFGIGGLRATRIQDYRAEMEAA